MLDDGKEFVGQTRDEAVARAASFFGVPADDLDVRVLSESVEISGLAGEVMIVARRGSGQEVAREPRESRDSRRDRPRDRDDGRRRRDDSRGRDDRRDGRRDGRGSGRDSRDSREREPRESRRPQRTPQAPSFDLDSDDPDLGDAGNFLRGMIGRMKIGDFTIEESREDREVLFRVEGEALGEIARSDDRIIMSLAHLVERILAFEDEDLRARIEVGVSDPEEQRLEEEARAQGEEVVRTGQSITLDPMNSRERWIVHNALKDVDGVRSESVGDGRVKRVQISKA